MDTITLVGIIGATLILLAFLLNQTGKITATSRYYEGINAVGSLFLVVYALLLNSVPFFILNIVWLLMSLRGLLKKNRL